MREAEAVTRFRALQQASGLLDTFELEAVFDALPPVDVQDILGQWKGGDLNSGHPVSRQLQKMKWFGKTFDSPLEAKPLICFDEQGQLYSSQAMGGEASLWMVAFRGKVSATMVYDARPVFDHFRKVDDNTLMGIMNGKGVLHEGRHYYFQLERVTPQNN